MACHIPGIVAEEFFHIAQNDFRGSIPLGNLEFEAKCFLRLCFTDSQLSGISDHFWEAAELYLANPSHETFALLHSDLVNIGRYPGFDYDTPENLLPLLYHYNWYFHSGGDSIDHGDGGE